MEPVDRLSILNNEIRKQSIYAIFIQNFTKLTLEVCPKGDVSLFFIRV